jgi:predicted lysophospholipase L1 biosynthesis ABC-type transport system permease subunit
MGASLPAIPADLDSTKDPNRAPEPRTIRPAALSGARLRLSIAITVSLVILQAGVGISNVLTMTVLSKVKEIAILRSMGYRRRDISVTFLWQGGLIISG